MDPDPRTEGILVLAAAAHELGDVLNENVPAGVDRNQVTPGGFDLGTGIDPVWLIQVTLKSRVQASYLLGHSSVKIILDHRGSEEHDVPSRRFQNLGQRDLAVKEHVVDLVQTPLLE